MRIRNAELSDCLRLAKMHKECLNRSFLGTLGEGFLAVLYRALVEYEDGMLIIAEDDDRTVGFISGAVDTGRFYNYFLKRNLFSTTFLLVPKLFKIDVIRKVLETLRYSRVVPTISLPKAELLSVAVTGDYQGKGVGGMLFNGLTTEFIKKDVKRFKVAVSTQLSRAQKFYEKMGGKFHSEVEVHKGESSKVYVWTL